MLVKLVRTHTHEEICNNHGILFHVNCSKSDQRHHPEYFNNQYKSSLIDPATLLIELLNSSIFSAENDYSPELETVYPAMATTLHRSRFIMDTKKLDSLSELQLIMHMLSSDRAIDHINRRIHKLGWLLKEISDIDDMRDRVSDDVIARYIEAEYMDTLKVVQENYYSNSSYEPLLHHYGISFEHFQRMQAPWESTNNEAVLNAKLRDRIFEDPRNSEQVKALHAELAMHCSRHSPTIPRHPRYQMGVAEQSPFVSLEAALEYQRLALEFEEICTWYEIRSLECFFAFAYIQCLKHGIDIRKCKVCGKFFISRHGSITCDETNGECKQQRIAQTKENRKNDTTISKANRVIKLYRNRIQNLSWSRPAEIFELILAYYRIICLYANKNYSSNQVFRKVYVEWLDLIGDLPKGTFSGEHITVYALVMIGDGNLKIENRSFAIEKGGAPIYYWLIEKHRGDVVFEEKVSKLSGRFQLHELYE